MNTEANTELNTLRAALRQLVTELECSEFYTSDDGSWDLAVASGCQHAASRLEDLLNSTTSE